MALLTASGMPRKTQHFTQQIRSRVSQGGSVRFTDGRELPI
jgi:hypothetical protein